jgi:uncharacterized protein YcbX
MIRVSGLHIYPVKSCGATQLESLEFDARGPCGDRRLMIVDPSGRFVTQRTHPRLALVQIERDGAVLTLKAPGMSALRTPLHPDGARIVIEVWRHRGEARKASHDADAWLAEYLGTAVSLVACAPEMHRIANRDWVDHDAPVGFADGYPILLISEGSLEALNRRLESPVSMSRFRPNLVVHGCDAFAEDDWRRIRINQTIFDIVKPCDRCVVTTIDPATGQKGREPLATLATFRRSSAGVLFGQNCIARDPGIIRLDDEVQVLGTGRLSTLPAEFRIRTPRDGG